MQEHEYALLGGMNRAKIGRYLSLASAAISAAMVFSLLTAVDLAKQYGLPVNLPPALLSLLGAGAIFSALYWFFDHYAWRWPAVARLLKVPDLAGEWNCVGKSLNEKGETLFDWSGIVTIVQSWDKLRVRLKTEKSGSNSIAAALSYDAADGYRLLYHYHNDPNINQPDLAPHQGYASITFAPDQKSGEGEYFNGRGRITFGTMDLRRR
ncbi:MAG: hypothetical protein K8R10_02990 [Rhodocyclales bacterium]|nr:hypothetical protein [Rhodocyclales bacterium]